MNGSTVQTPQPMVSVFKQKKKSQQLTSAPQAQMFATNKENQLLMMNNVFNQKRNSMNEAERRRQQLKKVQQQQINYQQDSNNNNHSRPIRSANASPSAGHHFLVNAMNQQPYMHQQQQQIGQFQSQQDKLSISQTNPHSSARPGTSNGILGQISKTQKNSPNHSKIISRPKTSSKLDHNIGGTHNSNPYNNTSATTASTTVNRATAGGQQTKSLGEDSVQRILKKSKVTKPQSRPQSGNKKRTTSSAQGNYDSQSDQQAQQHLMMMLIIFHNLIYLQAILNQLNRIIFSNIQTVNYKKRFTIMC